MKPLTNRQKAYMEVLLNPDEYKGKLPFGYMNQKLGLLHTYNNVVTDLLRISEELNIERNKNEGRTV